MCMMHILFKFKNSVDPDQLASAEFSMIMNIHFTKKVILNYAVWYLKEMFFYKSVIKF